MSSTSTHLRNVNVVVLKRKIKAKGAYTKNVFGGFLQQWDGVFTETSLQQWDGVFTENSL